MSFILDALRKSENERQRNATPGIADAPIRPRSQRRSFWIPLVAALLGINLSLLAVLWYVGNRDTPQNATTPSTALEPARKVQSAPATPSVQAPIVPLPDSTSVIADPTVSRELASEFATPPQPQPQPTAPAVAIPTPPPTGATPSIEVDEGSSIVDVPTLAELSLAGSVSLPTLHLDIHVYSDTPAERFVFINTAKYREGDKITEGPTVDKINQSGVVLVHQNRRFLLTRE